MVLLAASDSYFFAHGFCRLVYRHELSKIETHEPMSYGFFSKIARLDRAKFIKSVFNVNKKFTILVLANEISVLSKNVSSTTIRSQFQ